MTITHYIEAYDAKGQQILGNLDGQSALRDVYQPLKSAAWKMLQNPAGPQRPKWVHVAYWRLVNVRGEEKAVYYNPYRKE